MWSRASAHSSLRAQITHKALENIDSAVSLIDKNAESFISHQYKVEKHCLSITDSSLPSASSSPSPWPSPLRWSSVPLWTCGHSSASWSLLRSHLASQWLWRIWETPNPPGITNNHKNGLINSVRLDLYPKGFYYHTVACGSTKTT